jgi:formate hydrogenlyase transcriptional activator
VIPDRSLNRAESPTAKPQPARESDRLKLLLDITNTLVSNLEPRDLIRAISTSIRQVMRCDVVGVWLPDADQRQLRQRVMDFPESKGFAKEDFVQPVEGSLVGSAFKSGKAAIRTAADFTDNQAAADVVRTEGIQSGLALPLISRNRTLGVLTLASRVERSAHDPYRLNTSINDFALSGNGDFVQGGSLGRLRNKRREEVARSENCKSTCPVNALIRQVD